jgi:ssRNA-specific RNase YbeY (16S rRNA maturation enzyme)
MLLTLLQLFICIFCASSFDVEQQLRQTYTKCRYPTGVLSFTAERLRSQEDSVTFGDAARCLAQSAVLFHGF